MKKDVKLYNMILPTFMLLTMHPLMWVLSLTGNFIIDSIVLLLASLVVFKKFDGKFYKKNILKVWGLGFLADLIGAGYLFLGGAVGYSYINRFDEPIDSFMYNLMDGMNDTLNHSDIVTAYSVGFMISAMLVAAVAIFLMDYFMVFKNSGLTKKQGVIASLMFAILTAPYTYFLPEDSFNWYFNLFTFIGY
ncbi:MAG: hypothetical protein IJ433_05690 [Ruminococcus sp.]|nr:hypothetical protein [Ruminococcus sp.]